MKKLIIAACLVLSVPAASFAAVATVDRIVAVVNKDVITQSELSARMAEARVNLKRQNVPLPDDAVLQRQVLDQLVRDQLQLQYAASNGIEVSDGELDETIARLAQQNKTDVAGLRAKLSAEGIAYADFRDDLRRQVILDRLRDRVASRVNVSDLEVDQVMQAEAGKSRVDYRLAAILVSVPERADSKQIEDKMAKAQRALADLRAGKSFAQVAASYSDAKNALQGGELGWRASSSLPPDFSQLLATMKNGDVTNVIRSQSGFNIFQLLDKRNASDSMVIEQRRVRHILIKTNEAVSDADARARILQIQDRLKRGAKFEELAKLYSEDGSAPSGGDLGWVNEGDMVPEFERAYLALRPGEVSEPVRSQFGWHLIRVDGVRKQDVTGERERALVRQQIRQRKAEQQYQDWLQQLKDGAFVEDKLDDK